MFLIVAVLLVAGEVTLTDLKNGGMIKYTF